MNVSRIKAGFLSCIVWAACALTLTQPVSVSAAEPGWYIGGNVGVSRLTPDTSRSSMTLEDDQDVALGMALGYDFTRRLSLELAYSQLGDATLSEDVSIGYSALSAGLVAYVLGDAEDIADRVGTAVYARLGLSRVDNDSDIPLEQADSNAVWLGVGIEWHWSAALGLRAELASLDGDAQAATLGFVYRWGRRSLARAPGRPSRAPTPPPQPRSDSVASPAADSVTAELSPPADCEPPRIGAPATELGCARFTGVQRGLEFSPGTSALTPMGATLVNRLAAELLQYPAVVVEIAAHTDGLGGPEQARQLARQRAVEVARQLVARGVPVSQLRARAYGSSQPRADNGTAGGRRLNNRIELSVLP